MIEPDDLLAATIAASLRWPPPVPRRMTRREARRAVKVAHEAWPRIRELLFGELRRVVPG